MSGDTHALHLPGCPAALDVPAATDDCRCAELAALFQVPSPDECFGDRDPAEDRARWEAARAQAAKRYNELMRDLLADEQTALERYRGTSRGLDDVDRDIATARRLLADYRAGAARRPI